MAKSSGIPTECKGLSEIVAVGATADISGNSTKHDFNKQELEVLAEVFIST